MTTTAPNHAAPARRAWLPPLVGRLIAIALLAGILATAGFLVHVLRQPLPGPQLVVLPIPPKQVLAATRDELESRLAQLTAQAALVDAALVALEQHLERLDARNSAQASPAEAILAATPTLAGKAGDAAPAEPQGEPEAPAAVPSPAAVPTPAPAAAEAVQVAAAMSRSPAPARAPAPDPLAAGVQAYERGADARAYALLRPLAERGDHEAQYFIARIFLDGRLLPADPDAARRWARRAEAGGYDPAVELLRRLQAAGSS